MAHTIDPIESAKKGNMDFFNTVAVDEIRNFKSRKGDSVLSVSVSYGNNACSKLICKRCPELLYTANQDGSTALHHAAWNGNNDMVEFLICAADELQNSSATVQDIESGRRELLTMVTSKKRRTPLHDAVEKNRLICAKLLLEADHSDNLFGMVDIRNDTAMHMAVRNHNLEIVKLLVETDPAFDYAPNNFGQTPHLIAVQESVSGDNTTVAIRKLLIEKQPRECIKQIGERGWTLLHHASRNGDVSVVEDILEFSPECAELVDHKGQNFIHLAASLGDGKLLRHMMASTIVSDSILNQQDIDGNTPFHIATSKGNETIGLSMVYDPRVDKFALNKKGKNALAAINFDYDKRKAGIYGFIGTVDEKDLKDRSDFDLFVSALISTVSFTVGITMPGGYLSEGSHQGNAVLYKEVSFNVFVISNTIALALSLYAVFNHFCTKYLTNAEDIICQLQVATCCSLGSLFALMVAFISGSYAVLAVSTRLAIAVSDVHYEFSNSEIEKPEYLELYV